MREILTELDRWQRAQEDIALATLVRVRGSAPRRPGARLCLTRGGAMAGSVSGGCVENDVIERAQLVLADGEPVVATYGVADEAGLEVGLSCGSTIDVLIERFAPTPAWQALRRALERREPAALAIGLSPAALLGRQLVVLRDDGVVGTLAADLDPEVVAAARLLLRDGGTRVLEVPCAGGERSVFLEAFAPPLRLFIVGATHTGMTLCRLAKPLGFRVAVVDARGAYATRERFPEADEILRAQPGEVLDQAELDAASYVVTLTHDPKLDLPALASALRSPARYVGAMGSRSTHERRKAALRDDGFTDADLARIRAPVGLDLGGRSPEEIALAILAEMIATRYGRDRRP